MIATTAAIKSPSAARRTTVLAVAAGVVIAIAASAIDAYAAYAAGASTSFAALRPAIFAPFVAVGVVVAYLGWSIIRRRSAHPAKVLRILVPVILLLSFIPDVLLLITGFIPGSSLTGVVALALMHLIVAGVAVPLSMRLAPVR